MPPPVTATLPDGVLLELRPLAREISDRHLGRHSDDIDRYGEVARDWCIRDNQHLLNWAVLDAADALSFHEQLAWLANVLGSRGYPLASLADDLETAARSRASSSTVSTPLSSPTRSWTARGSYAV